MFRDQQREIRVVRLLRGVFVGVAVHRYDAIGIFIDHGPAWIHAEGSHQILVLLGLIDDLAFIHLIGDVAENRCGQLHAHADVHAI